MAKMVLPKICPGDQIWLPYLVRDQIWQPYLVLWDRILLPDFVLGQNVAATFGPTLPYVVLLHRT